MTRLRDVIGFVSEMRRGYRIHHITAFSAQMAYFFILSLFPFLIFLVSLISWFSIDNIWMMNSLGRIMPSDAAQIIQDYMLNLADSGSKSLISVSIIAALWTASKAINALMRALNIVYEVKETRGYFKIRLMGMFYTFLFALSIILALVLPSMGRDFFRLLEAYIYIPKYFVDFFTSIRWVGVLGFLALVFGSTHVVLPNVKIGFKQAMPGALFSLIGWLTLSYGFSHFVQNFSRFTIVYGSLAAVMVLLIWMYFSSMIVMFGAEINHYLIMLRSKQDL